MENRHSFTYVQLSVGCLFTFLTCVLGDKLLEHHLVAKTPALRALVDSLTHGFVGVFSWVVVVAPELHIQILSEILLCGALASLLDIDHFIAAGSFKLKDALSLPSRPPFHNTMLIPVITIGLYLLVLVYKRLFHCCVPIVINCPFIFMIAWLSHHIRDATRRGLWFAPFGSTPPLPQWLYISLSLCLPVLMNLIFNNELTLFRVNDQRLTNTDESVLSYV